MTIKGELFSRLVEGHKPDCALSMPGSIFEVTPDPEALAQRLGSDAHIAYAIECRPIYEDLRRIIGQLAGLLILARLTSSNGIMELTELDRCRLRGRQTKERLAALTAPTGLERHKAHLDDAQAFSALAMEDFSERRGGASSLAIARLDRSTACVKRAYAHLEVASSTKAGLEMVDFRHACCSCAT